MSEPVSVKVRALPLHDYFCRVVEDCVAGSSQEAHDAALRAMEYLQTGARRRSAEIIAAFEAYKNRAASE